jgi:hypothetical protein
MYSDGFAPQNMAAIFVFLLSVGLTWKHHAWKIIILDQFADCWLCAGCRADDVGCNHAWRLGNDVRWDSSDVGVHTFEVIARRVLLTAIATACIRATQSV